jgi:hypothetical protein
MVADAEVDSVSMKSLIIWTLLALVAAVIWAGEPRQMSNPAQRVVAPPTMVAPDGSTKFPAQAWVNPNPAPLTAQRQPPSNAVPLVFPKGYVAPPEQNLVKPGMIPPPVAAPTVGQNPPPTATQGLPGTTMAVPMYSRMQPPPHHPPAEEPPKN